jgi:catechol 2,3-dioxygenase-like lactoylglutathione lyase family enzyme
MPATELLMVSATTPDLEATAQVWTDGTHYQVRAESDVASDLAEIWGAEKGAHPRTVVTGAPGASRGMVRFIAARAAQRPRRPIYDIRGPMAIEFFARDASLVHQRFASGAEFVPITEPIDYDLSSIGSGRVQSVGLSTRWGLTVFISTMKWVPPPRQLPVTPDFLGPAVNVPIVALDREKSVAFYSGLLGIPVRFDGPVSDADVNRIMGAPPDLGFHITVFFIADGQMAEHHFHDPRRVVDDGRDPGLLRTGTVGSTYRVTGLDDIVSKARAMGLEPRGPSRIAAAPYDSGRVVGVTGPNGELVELVES